MLWHFLFWEILNLNEPDVAVCRFRLRANVNFHHVTKFSIDLSFILLSQLLVVPVVYTVTVAMTMAILMPPVWCILWKFVKPRYCSNVSKHKGAVERLFGICLRFQGHFTQRAFHTPVKHLNYHLFNLLKTDVVTGTAFRGIDCYYYYFFPFFCGRSKVKNQSYIEQCFLVGIIMR